jgi:hypothetical protein
MSPPAGDLLLRILRRPRNRILLGVVLLGVGLRIALPYLLRPQIVSRADAALVGRITLADLDLSLLRGGVTLHGLEVYADELPPPGAPAAEEKPPLFAAKRLWTQISWLALLGKTIEVEELELDGFVARLDRLKDGVLLPKPVPSEAPDEPEPEQPQTWSFAADSVALRDGQILFRDFTVGEEPQYFDLAVKDISARQLALVIDPSGREPGHVAIAAQIGEGRLGLESQVESKPEGPAAVSRIALANLPIGGLRVYLTRFGWSDLAGSFDANIEHRFETGGAHELAGSVSLSDVAVTVPELDRPALAWKKLGIGIEKIDLVNQLAAVSEVALDHAQIVVAPRAEAAVPLIAPPPGALAGAPAQPTEPAASSPAPATGAGKPWSWRVAKARVADSSIDVLGSGQMLPLALEAELRDLASEADAKSPVTLSLDSGKGSLALEGALGLSPLAFDGKLRIVDFSLPPLLACIDAPGVALLRKGNARADLRIALAPRAAAEADLSPTDLRVEGTIGLAGIDIGEPKTSKDFGAAWKDLEVGIRELSVPGLIGAGDPGRPLGIVVNLNRVRLLEPSFQITRVQEGILLPSLSAEPSAPAPAPAPAPEPAASVPAASPAPAPEIRVEVAEARIQGGRAQIVDRTVQPFYRSKIDELDLKARGIRWPGPVVQNLVLAMRGMQGAKLDVRGSLAARDSKIELKLTELPLAPFNSYVTPRGYSLTGGTLSFDSKGEFQRGSYDTSSRVVLSQLDVGGAQGEALFQENFGIPLSVALGLLKDLEGNIQLAVPVAGDTGGAKVGVASLIRQALRKALVGALASPLKLFGAVTSGDKVESLAPEPIAFAAGSAEISQAGGARIEQLAGLLSASPGVALTLRGATSPEDVRWLKEQALLEELRATSGVRALGKLGEIGTRGAVREYLEAHFAGRDAPLEENERIWLELQVAQQTADPARLAALAEARAAAAQKALASEYGIAPARLTLGPPASEAPAAVPGVVIALGALPRASP